MPVAPVPTLDEIVADEARHRGVVRDAEHPVVGPYREIAPPIIFDDTPMSVRRPAPLVGQHTVELLDEVGFTADEIAALLAAHTVHRAQEVPDVQL